MFYKPKNAFYTPVSRRKFLELGGQAATMLGVGSLAVGSLAISSDIASLPFPVAVDSASVGVSDMPRSSPV